MSDGAPLPGNLLRLSPRLRFFVWQGHRVAHMPASLRPAVFLSLNEPMQRLLERLDGVTALETLAGPDAQLRSFLASLLWVGVLLDRPPAEERPPRLVDSLWIFPTSDCNLRCRYCYSEAGATPPVTVPIQTAYVAIEHFFDVLAPTVRRVKVIFHGGGEPTLALDVLKSSWEACTRRALQRRLGASLLVVTNGVWGEDVLEWLTRERALVSVSLDGPRDVHDRQRPDAGGRGSFDVVSNNARGLTRAGVLWVMKSTVTADAVARMDESVGLALELGASGLVLEPCGRVGRGCELAEAEPPAPAFAAGLCRCVTLGAAVGLPVSSPLIRCLRSPHGGCCAGGEVMLGLTPDGHISACPEVVSADDPAAASFFYGRVDGNRVAIDEARASRLSGRNVGSVAPCSSCFLTETCAGGCAVRAFRASGSLSPGDPYLCEVTRLVNAELITAVAEGRLEPAPHLGPQTVSVGPVGLEPTSLPWARLVTVAPPDARPARAQSAHDRPFLPVPAGRRVGPDLLLPASRSPVAE